MIVKGFSVNNNLWDALRDCQKKWNVLHQWEGETHRALSDTQATRSVWHYLTRPDVRQRIDALKNV